MDSLVAAAARALASGDPLGALKRVALREDPAALALRGIAMAQLGEFARARDLLRRAASGFGVREPKARARCVVAASEVALAQRDFSGWSRSLELARATLEAHGDRPNALQARLVEVRHLLLVGRLTQAAAALARLDVSSLPPAMAAVAELAAAELAFRSLRSAPGRAALARAEEAARRASVPSLVAEVGAARALLEGPVARRFVTQAERPLDLDSVVAIFDSGALVIDACRRVIVAGGEHRALARRPVLFALGRALGEAWPGDIARDALIQAALGVRRPGESHRARLRVELGRLRKVVAPLASIVATPRGFVLQPKQAPDVVVLLPPIEGDQASLLALLSDGAAWSTSALALALGASQRTVQRALGQLEAEGRVRSTGRARAQRWLGPPLIGFTTILLLPTALPLE